MRVQLFVPVIVCCVGSVASQNLVPNPSFEEVTACPSFASQLERAAPWVNPNLGTPELYHGCAPANSYVSVPDNSTGGHQLARTGIGYAGLYCWRTDIANMREYAQVALTEPLQAGTCYRVAMFVNMPNDHPYATDGFGAHFSFAPISSAAGQVISVAPQIANGTGNLITDTLGWTEISGIYTAVGGESHLTIGNFLNDASTQTLQVATDVWYQTSAYLLVDDVSVEAIELEIDLGMDTVLCAGTTLLLDATTADATYSWDDGSNGSTRTVNGGGTYWVEVALGGCTVSDTITVGAATVPSVMLPADTLICPNSSMLLDVSGTEGAIVWSDGDTARSRSIHVPGTYAVHATNACGTSTDRIVIGTDLCPCIPYMPNAFTPNNDGINDRVAPQFACGSEALRWTIYDRWGRRVFQTEGDTPWDGTNSGKEAPDGVYVWRAEVVGDAGANAQHSGHVVLIR